MNILSVVPHTGIGPLKLTMSPRQILAAIDELQNSYKLPNDGNMQASAEEEKGWLYA